jgi:predicted permease
VLGISPAVGRDLDASDATGRDRVVLVAHHVWTHLFGSDPGVVSRTMDLDGQSYTIVGVLPAELTFPDVASFQMPNQADVWIPMAWVQLRGESRGNQVLRVVASARPGVTDAEIARDLESVAAQFRQEHPNRYSPKIGWRLRAEPFREELVGSSRPALLLLVGAAGLVLLIACANVANLLLGRGAVRRQEFAVKTALGATWLRLVKDFTSEAAILGAGAGVVAVLTAVWALPILRAIAPSTLPHVADTRLDLVTLSIAAALSAVVIALVGVGPALAVSSRDVQPILREEAAGPEHGFWRWVRAGLIVSEVAIAFLVLTLAALLVRSGIHLSRVDLGFSPGGVASTELSLPVGRYPRPEHSAAFFGEVIGGLRRQPHVRQAALADPLPLSTEAWSGTFGIDGRQTAPGEPMPHAEYYRVSDGYFRTIGIPLVAGRDFSEQDDTRAPNVVIVDTALASQYFPGESAIGKRLLVYGPKSQPATIVGVAAHVQRDGPRQFGEAQLYLPFFQDPFRRMNVVIRADSDAALVASSVRGVVRSVDASLPVSRIVRLDDLVARATAVDRFNLLLTTTFAACALMLAGVGLYGVFAYLITRNAREIAIRMALGGMPRAVTRRLLVNGSLWIALGIVAGVAGAAAVSRSIASLVFGISPLDVPTLLVSGLLTFLISLGAIALPARRILRMDPVQALRR